VTLAQPRERFRVAGKRARHERPFFLRVAVALLLLLLVRGHAAVAAPADGGLLFAQVASLPLLRTSHAARSATFRRAKQDKILRPARQWTARSLAAVRRYRPANEPDTSAE
jgi:hypothetical protein